jgi:hypothetical protein
MFFALTFRDMPRVISRDLSSVYQMRIVNNLLYQEDLALIIHHNAHSPF